VIRGAFIFAVGLSIGYIKGLTDGENVANAIGSLGEIFKDVADAPIEGTATETPPTNSDNQDSLNEGENANERAE
jgi:hypothetical protein